MVRFSAALLLGRLLPRWWRDRVFEASYHELLADYLAAGARHAGPGHLWRRTSCELRAVVMALECWRLLLAGRFGRDQLPAGRDQLPAGNAPPPNRPPRRSAWSIADTCPRATPYARRTMR